MVACEHERLRTGHSWERSFTRARHCVWADTNHTLSTNLIGEPRVRFDSNERYPNYHSVEQLLHWPCAPFGSSQPSRPSRPFATSRPLPGSLNPLVSSCLAMRAE